LSLSHPLSTPGTPMLVFLSKIRIMGGVMLIMEKIIVPAPETRILKMLQNLEKAIVIAMATKENLKRSFLLLPLGLKTNLILAKVVTVCPKNVRSILTGFVFVAE
jgi:hypothetical protein